MARVYPCPGERRIVDQPGPGKPVQGRIGCVLRHTTTPQGLIEELTDDVSPGVSLVLYLRSEATEINEGQG